MEAKTPFPVNLSYAAKAKRTNDRSNPAYKWTALAITLLGAAAFLHSFYRIVKLGQNCPSIILLCRQDIGSCKEEKGGKSKEGKIKTVTVPADKGKDTIEKSRFKNAQL